MKSKINEAGSDSWVDELKLDIGKKEIEEEPVSICPSCKYFYKQLEDEGWEYSISYWGWYCFAKDEEGEDLHDLEVLEDYFIEECPYFVKAETHEK